MLSRSITYSIHPGKTNMDTKNCHTGFVERCSKAILLPNPSCLRSMLVFGSFYTDVPENCWHAGDEPPPPLVIPPVPGAKVRGQSPRLSIGGETLEISLNFLPRR